MTLRAGTWKDATFEALMDAAFMEGGSHRLIFADYLEEKGVHKALSSFLRLPEVDETPTTTNTVSDFIMVRVGIGYPILGVALKREGRWWGAKPVDEDQLLAWAAQLPSGGADVIQLIREGADDTH